MNSLLRTFYAIIRASCASGLVVVAVMCFVSLPSFFCSDVWGNFVGAYYMGFISFLMVFLFTLALLIPLYPVFRYTSRGFSFSIFFLVGFAIPAKYFLDYYSTPSRSGEIYLVEDPINAISGIVVSGLLGASCATASWISLYRSSKKVTDDSISLRRK